LRSIWRSKKALLAQVHNLLLDDCYSDIVALYGAKALAKASVRDVQTPLLAGSLVSNMWLES
jgi:hypothetical protein